MLIPRSISIRPHIVPLYATCLSPVYTVHVCPGLYIRVVHPYTRTQIRSISPCNFDSFQWFPVVQRTSTELHPLPFNSQQCKTWHLTLSFVRLLSWSWLPKQLQQSKSPNYSLITQSTHLQHPPILTSPNPFSSPYLATHAHNTIAPSRHLYLLSCIQSLSAHPIHISNY